MLLWVALEFFFSSSGKKFTKRKCWFFNILVKLPKKI
jgi:hypothetical protein